MLALIPLIALVDVALTGLYWGAGVNQLGDYFLVIAETPPPEARRLAGLLAVAPAVLAWLWALTQLFQLFWGFSRGVVIGERTVRRLRGFALFTALTAAFDVAGSGVRRWAAGEFDGSPFFSHIQLTTEHLALIFTAMVFYLVSFALVEATAYKDEAESYL